MSIPLPIHASLVGAAPGAELCIRAGHLSPPAIADDFELPHHRSPRPDDPISIHRAESDGAYEELRAAGVPVEADRDRCWRDFAGWRVNDDRVLLELCAVVQPPPAPWSSDRMADRPRFRSRRAARRGRAVLVDQEGSR